MEKLKKSDVIVVRYEETKGGLGMQNVKSYSASFRYGNKDVALITDGRFSGGTGRANAIGHICPESGRWGVQLRF